LTSQSFEALIQQAHEDQYYMQNGEPSLETPFNLDILKQSVDQAKQQLVNAHQNDNENLFQFFVAGDALESAVEQSVDIIELPTSSRDLFTRLELYPLQKRLTEIQQTVESNLRTIIGGSRSGCEPTDISILAETPQYYILYDKFEILQDSLQAEYEVPYTVRTAHRLQANQILDRVKCDAPSTDAPIWIIQKPSHWYDGQWAMIQTLSHFIQCGMSPTEALDYWMVEIMNSPVRYWAHVRGKTKESIYNHLRKAKGKIDVQAHPESPSGYDFTNRTYSSEKIEDLEYITVDNGFLHPRRDLMNPSLSGKMTSGNKGAGPKQLAVALLADSLGDEQARQLAPELHGQIYHLAKTDEDGNWTLSEERLKQWYWSQ
jgi:hypothetical protein